LTWSKHTTVTPPNLALRDCPLARIDHDNNKLYLIRKSDYSELWVLDLLALRWANLETFGQRSGNYASNPSFAIRDGQLYALGGQLGVGPAGKKANHVHRLTLSPHISTRESRLKSRVARMFQDDYTDVVFFLAGEEEAEGDSSSNSSSSNNNSSNSSSSNSSSSNSSSSNSNSNRRRSLRAHRSILCQNDFFRGLLQGRFSEGVPRHQTTTTTTTTTTTPEAITQQQQQQQQQEGSSLCFQVTLPDTDYDSFYALLQFYYEQLDLSDPAVDLAGLYRLADEYLEEDLKKEIVAYLGNQVAGKDALRLYEAALGLFECPVTMSLKRKAEEIIANDLEKVAKTEEFSQFCRDNCDVMPQFTLAIAQRTIKQ